MTRLDRPSQLYEDHTANYPKHREKGTNPGAGHPGDGSTGKRKRGAATRSRGWLRSAAAPEGRVRQGSGYLVGAIGLLLAEPLDLLLEFPDLLLHVHGASDCRSVSISGLRDLSVSASEFLDLVVVAPAGRIFQMQTCRRACAEVVECRQPSSGQLRWKLTGPWPSSELLADQAVSCELVMD